MYVKNFKIFEDYMYYGKIKDINFIFVLKNKKDEI